MDIPPESLGEDDECEYWVCRYHTAEAELLEDADCWYGWHEGNGPMEEQLGNYDLAEGFRFSCCGSDGSNEGCRGGLHVATA
ncbi:hypothetical protein RQP46_000646 [Phenoliferia psychrophenolica]